MLEQEKESGTILGYVKKIIDEIKGEIQGYEVEVNCHTTKRGDILKEYTSKISFSKTTHIKKSFRQILFVGVEDGKTITCTMPYKVNELDLSLDDSMVEDFEYSYELSDGNPIESSVHTFKRTTDKTYFEFLGEFVLDKDMKYLIEIFLNFDISEKNPDAKVYIDVHKMESGSGEK